MGTAPCGPYKGQRRRSEGAAPVGPRRLCALYAGTGAEFKAPNGKTSNLLEALGEEQGRQAWYAVRTAGFKEWFGDWEGLEYQEMPGNDWPADVEDLLSVFETEDSSGWKLLGGIDGYENAKHQRDEDAAEEVVRQVFEMHPEAKEKVKDHRHSRWLEEAPLKGAIRFQLHLNRADLALQYQVFLDSGYTSVPVAHSNQPYQ
jgi:hypothetical protein